MILTKKIRLKKSLWILFKNRKSRKTVKQRYYELKNSNYFYKEGNKWQVKIKMISTEAKI